MRTSIERDSHLMFETRYLFDVEDMTLVAEFETPMSRSKLCGRGCHLNANVTKDACFT